MGTRREPAGERTRWLLETAVASVPLALVGVLPWSRTTMSLERYVPIHSFMETFAIVVAMLVFASAWSTPKASRGHVILLATGFLAVGLLDFAHTFSYASMPPFVTPSGPAKAIYFWLAARFLAALTILGVPLLSREFTERRASSLAASLGLTALVYVVVLGAPSTLPEVYVQGVGLTRGKVGAELVVTALYASAFVLLVVRGAPSFPGASVHLTRAAMLMTLGEVPFALYRTVADGFNFTGHAYKVAAYFFVYRAIFVETVRRPHTELEASLDALRESEERFRQLAENVREVFWLREVESGRFLYLSPGFEAVFGRRPDEEQDVAWVLSFVHPDDRDGLARAVHGPQEAAQTLEYRIVRPDGEVRWVRSTSFPVLGARDRPRRVAGITADITEERRAGEILARAQRMEGLGRFAGGVAHDFNNLLTVIFASLELAQLELPSDHPANADLRHTLEAAARARELTAQLLAFAKKRPGEERRIDLGQQVANATAMLRPMLGASIELSVLVDPGEHAVRIDPGQMDQVLLNLITNAKDAMPGGGTIVASVHRVAEGPPGVGGASAWVRLRVEDDGSGMPPEVVKHAFEPFYTTKGPGRGTGLGLATSFGIVAQAGGTIVIDSDLGCGTRMDVFLPLSEGPLEPREARAEQGDLRGTETILLVEDQAAVRDFTRRFLQQAGYRVLTGTNGVDALEVVEHHDGPIDLLLSDVVMPLMGGPELAQRLLAARPSLKVLFVTGYAGESPSSLEHPLFAKPYTGSALLARVRQILDAALPRSSRARRTGS